MNLTKDIFIAVFFYAYPCTTFGVIASKSYVGVVGTNGSGCHSSINSSSSCKYQESKLLWECDGLTISCLTSN